MVFRPPGLNFRFISRITDRRTQRGAWETFVTRHQLHPGVHIVIARSWSRCWSLLDPYQKSSLSRLGADHLLSTQVANFELLLIARPIMEDIFQYIEGSGTAVVITNAAGYILDLLGDEDILDKLRADGIDRGISVAEHQMGTNAFALAVLERLPVQVAGPEHYLERFHEYTESSAPIFDLTGNPLGALGVINFAQNHHIHSLGLVVAGARAIEGQRQSDHLLDEQNRQLASVNEILASIDEGIIVWNNMGVIIHVNAAAARILQTPVDHVMGAHAEEKIEFPNFVMEAIRQHNPLSNIEAQLQVNGRPVSCVMSLRFIPGANGTTGAIAVLRSAQDVRRLVHRQVGAQASLSLDNLVGDSSQMRRLRRSAETAAAARASIIIRGESGTGKNLLARAIHNHGPQREGPFIVFPCTAIPGELEISEMVGIEDGLPTTPLPSRPGKFELADGGTIFLKDVEALSLEAQSVLLNLLELGIVQRLGSRTPISVQVRVIASSSTDLESLMEQGNFRTDLYYRLSPFEILIPPLRDRLEDLPLLVENILERIHRYQLNPLQVAPETLTVLRAYHWPGNVRELEGVLERAFAQADDSPLILPEHLPETILHPTSLVGELPTVPPLDELEKQAILRAARVCRGNLTQMARVLGVGRTTMWRRLKQLEISLDQYRSN